MDVKPGYKQTEVGIIPEDWEAKSLDSVAFVTSGKRLPLGQSLTEYETPHPYVRVTDMRLGTVSVADIRFVPVDVFPAIRRYRIFKEDIFISVAGTLGIVGKIPSELNGANLTENADRITNITCSRDYLLHVLMSPLIQNTIDSLQTVGAQPKLALTRIRKFNVPLPPTKAEQKAIAQALSDADALIESLEQLLTKKRQIKQGTMQEMLTGKKRLPGFSEEWQTRQLGEVINHCSSGATPYRGRPDYYTGTMKWITSGELNYNVITDTIEHISEEAVQKTNLKIHPAGTFLMAITGLEAAGTRGACGIVGSPATTNQSCMAIYPSIELKTVFLYHYYVMRGNELALQYCQGTKQQSYTAKLVRLLPIDLPPTIQEQTAIAIILSDMDAEIAVLESKLAKARRIKQGMMQELLTGRIRLI